MGLGCEEGKIAITGPQGFRMSINWIPPSSAFLTSREMEVDQQVPVCAMSLMNLI